MGDVCVFLGEAGPRQEDKPPVYDEVEAGGTGGTVVTRRRGRAV